MYRKSSELKTLARESLRTHYALMIGATLLVFMIAWIGNVVSVSLFGNNSVFSTVMGQIFSFIVTLIMSIFSAGLSYMMLKLGRGQSAEYKDLFYLFQHHPDRVIIVSFVLTVIEYVAMAPYLIYVYRSFDAPMKDVEELMLKAVTMSLLMLAGALVATLITLPFSMSYYFLIDDDSVEAVEALKLSVKMMNGNYKRYIGLLLSFLGLGILGFLSCYIGFLWIGPYLQMSQIEFYRELSGELEGAVAATEPVWKSGEKNPELDDYNAEA